MRNPKDLRLFKSFFILQNFIQIASLTIVRDDVAVVQTADNVIALNYVRMIQMF